MAEDTLAILAREFGFALQPLRRAVSSPREFEGFMLGLGWSADAIPAPVLDLAAALVQVEAAAWDLADGDSSAATIERLLNGVRDSVAGIRQISAAPDAAFPPALVADHFKNEFPPQVLQHLLVDYLRQRHGALAFLLHALGVVKFETRVPAGNRPAYTAVTLDFSDLPRVLNDPSVVFRNAFGWGTDTPDFSFLFHALDDLLLQAGMDVRAIRVGDDAVGALEEGAEPPGDPVRRGLDASLFERAAETGTMSAGFVLFPLPATGSRKPGLAVMPYTRGEISERLELMPDLHLTVQSGLDLQGGVGLTLRPDEGIQVIVGFAGGGAGAHAEGMFTVRLDWSRTDGQPFLLLGSRDGTRVEMLNSSGTGGLYIDAEHTADLYAETEVQGARLTIAPGEGDGFLQKVLPRDGISVRFDAALGLSTKRGLYFRGSGGLEVNVPAHLALGPIELQSVTVAVRPSASAIPIDVGASLKVELGPLLATVSRMGLTATLSFPDSGGNLGPADLTFGFKPPDGVGLLIDANGFKGGGFLAFDFANQRYSGVLQLEFGDTIALKCIGLITTREGGFSLLIIITAEFSPIQLGLGFTLNGVGGLLGLHRTMMIEPLRAGVKEQSLDNILFPSDPIANADRIISDLQAIFPPAEGRFVFGPMAQIGWATPSLITIEMGLVIEVPNPVRLAILGVLKALLPDEELKLLVLQVNFLGVIEIEKQQLSFDATLFESRLLTFTLSGDMAVRVCWGAQRNLLLSVGGFHPAFEPPPLNLPVMARLTITLLEGDNPRIRCETYFAITSNTVQFGARVELYAKVSKFNVYGFLGLDTLIQRSPFHLVAEIGASLAVRIGSSEIMGIRVTLTLEGPTPWIASGKGKFKICWFLSFTVKFHKTFGEARDTALPDVDVLPLLLEALAHTGNWAAELPPQSRLLVTTRDLSALTGVVLVHPFGTLRVTQKVVPLEVTIDRFGGAKPAGTNRFSISAVSSGVGALAADDAREQFAPAQFQEMSDAEKLSRKSFEEMKAGKRIDPARAIDASYAVRRDVEYERIIIDRKGARMFLQFVAERMAIFVQLLRGNAVSRCPLARNAHRQPSMPQVSVRDEGFVVVRSGDLTPVAGGAHATEWEAREAMRRMTSDDPALAGAVEVVPAYEASAA